LLVTLVEEFGVQPALKIQAPDTAPAHDRLPGMPMS